MKKLTIKKPTLVKFTTKDGKNVFLKATKIVNKPVRRATKKRVSKRVSLGQVIRATVALERQRAAPGDSVWYYKLDPSAQAEYIGVRKGVIVYTRELRNGLNIDLDARGNILGIELINLVSKR